MPSFMVKADLDSGALVRLLPEWRSSALELWALLPAGRKAPPRARALIELLARGLPPKLARVK
jgi:DNA-binding transcriptional LysR family regulator